MLTSRYLASTKNLPAIFDQIRKGTAPSNFNYEHLKSLGFSSSNDRAIVPLLKELGFLTDGGMPTNRYHSYRDESRSRVVLGEALEEAYGDLFHVNATPSEKDRQAIEGKFKATHNVTDRVAEAQTATFYALLKLADLEGARKNPNTSNITIQPDMKAKELPEPTTHEGSGVISLRYNIEVHLPATKEIEVYNAIFKSLRDNLLA